MSCRVSIFELISVALSKSPSMAYLHIMCISNGATFAVTEIFPEKPSIISDIEVLSSPVKICIFSEHSFISCIDLSLFPEASLIPTIFVCVDNLCTVSGSISTDVLPGTLYNICGIATVSPIFL